MDNNDNNVETGLLAAMVCGTFLIAMAAQASDPKTPVGQAIAKIGRESFLALALDEFDKRMDSAETQRLRKIIETSGSGMTDLVSTIAAESVVAVVDLAKQGGGRA